MESKIEITADFSALRLRQRQRLAGRVLSVISLPALKGRPLSLPDAAKACEIDPQRLTEWFSACGVALRAGERITRAHIAQIREASHAAD